VRTIAWSGRMLVCGFQSGQKVTVYVLPLSVMLL
jgi:hypothetical protein